MQYPLPANERERLLELRSYDLDTLPDQALNEIVHLAAEICGAPTAVISVIEEARQWFKAKVGVESEGTPREVAFCAHAICQPDLFIIPDASADERFAQNPLVTGDPHIRFYAGAPLVTPAGNALGTICVIDRQPRTLTPEQRRALTVLSRQVVMQLELKRSLALGREAEEQLARAHADLEIRVRERTAELHAAYERARQEADERRRLQQQLHALAAHLTEVREDERKGLARELHDELGQMLTALRMDAAWIARICAERKEAAMARLPQRLDAMKELIGQAISTVQRIASDLRPGMLDELGLVAALEWQAQEFEQRSGLATAFDSNVEEAPLPSNCALAVYRVLQEALTNIARHAGATAVEIAFECRPERCSLTIRDNGKGLPPDALAAPTSLGLIGIRERAQALGGDVVFSETPGGGVTVTMQVPVSRPAPETSASPSLRSE